MGCKGSKAAEAPKSEVACSTLLTRPDETKEQAAATQGSATAKASEEIVADSSVETGEEALNGAAVGANTLKAKETVEAPNDTVTKAEEVKTELAAEKASATGQPTAACNDEKTAAQDDFAIAVEVVADKAVEADIARKAVMAESAVTSAVANDGDAGQYRGCLSYCTSTEAQTEIICQKHMYM